MLSALQFFATEPWQLIVLRILMGIAIGADFAIAGTIASEFAPQKARGPLAGRHGHDVSVGAAVAYIVGYFMLTLGPDAWRWMLASSAIPARLILIMRLGTPESPRWLLSKGRAEEAEAVLKQMFGPDATLADIEEPEDSPKGYRTIFRRVYLKRTVFVCTVLGLPAAADLRDQHLRAHHPGFLRAGRGERDLPGRGDHPDLLRAGLAVGCAVCQSRAAHIAAVELRDLRVPLLGLAVLPRPSAFLVVLLFAVFGVAFFSSQCLRGDLPVGVVPDGGPRHRERIRDGSKQSRRSDRHLRGATPARLLGAADDARRRRRSGTRLADDHSAGAGNQRQAAHRIQRGLATRASVKVTSAVVADGGRAEAAL